MTETSATQKTIKYGSSSVGIGAGNAVAYFALEYLRTKDLYTPDDAVVAMAMGGALVSIIFLETRRVTIAIGKGLKYVFDRMYPHPK